MLPAEDAWEILNRAEQIFSADDVERAIKRLAVDITQTLQGDYPLVLSVMGGAVVFSGHLLPLLRFPLEFDAIHVSRYGDETQGGELQWRVLPKEPVAGRTILVLDDILDEGHTLVAIRDKMLALGAKRILNAVLVDKTLARDKPIKANFVGLTVPNRYVFGCGMDAFGLWRNLPAIYALKQAELGNT
ncbi:MAG: hypoxanthine-guanine phosphoribosyltransferase [Burkholderiales bacterium]